MDKRTIVCGSHRPYLVEKVRQGCPSHEVIHFDGTGAKCFSWLMNQCILAHPDEYVMIVSDRAYPTDLDVERMYYLLEEQNFGFVTFLGLGCFGLHKSLINRIGWFDERYIRGNHEDNDWFLRLGEANVGIYQDLSCLYDWNFGGTWGNYTAYKHFKDKWYINEDDGYVIRKLPEENYNYNIGSFEVKLFRGIDNSIVKNSIMKYIRNEYHLLKSKHII